MKARFMGRFIAYCLDYAFAMLVGFGLVRLFGLSLPLAQVLAKFFVPEVFYGYIFHFIYILICYCFIHGVTIGGLICNVKVINNDGTALKKSQAVLRAFLQTIYPLAILNIPYMLIYHTQVSLFDACVDSQTVRIHKE